MIACDVKDGVARVAIHRATHGNALTAALVKRLRDILRELATAKIVILTGEGADFCLGRDRQESKSGTPYDAFSVVAELNDSLAGLPGILITAVRGRAFGLGLGLVMRSDIAIASIDAVFALDEVKLGIPPMFIMSAIGDHMAPKHALDAILTSREIDAATALQMGLVSRVVASTALDDSLEQLVADLAARNPEVLLACKSYFRSVNAMPPVARGAFALVEQARFAQSHSH